MTDNEARNNIDRINNINAKGTEDAYEALSKQMNDINA